LHVELNHSAAAMADEYEYLYDVLSSGSVWTPAVNARDVENTVATG
jgi:hypothetical protein